MSRYDFYQYFPVSTPIKTDKGIKAKSKRGAFGKSWWARRWIKALERFANANRLQRGRRYARAGQVTALTETPNGVQAKVQGSQRRPYNVTIEVDPLTEAQWDKVIDLLADQAIYSVQLLAGEMPDDIEDAFAAAGVSLFPEKADELFTDCSCPDWSNPCKHLAAVHYILGEQFDEDPFLIFRLRGRDQEELLAALRERRAGDLSDDLDDGPAEIVVPLDETLDHFWGDAQALSRVPVRVKSPDIPLPILKRLGQPNFLAESITAILGPAHQAITEQALAMTYEQANQFDEP